MSSIYINGGTKPKPENKRTKFFNLLVLVHLKKLIYRDPKYIFDELWN